MKKLKVLLSVLCALVIVLSLVGFVGCNTNKEPDYSDVAKVSVVSDLYGTGFTNGGTCLPDSAKVSYDESTSAKMTVSSNNGEELDLSKLDTSEAYIKIEDGDGYYAYDLKLNGAELGNFTNGEYTYHLGNNAFEWVNDADYFATTTSIGGQAQGGLEWSCQGGDGNGLYTFNLSVNGIKYDGKLVRPGYFRAKVYIYGREFSDASNTWGIAGMNLDFVEPTAKAMTAKVTAGNSPVWTWEGCEQADGYTKPMLCDMPTGAKYDAIDNFYITWPSAANAASIKAEDITIKLTTNYSDIFAEDIYTLKPNAQMKTLANGKKMPDGDYSVFYDSATKTTQIAVNMVYWKFAPVYTKMTITVNKDKVSGYDQTIEKTYDIASVYAYNYQTGGAGNNAQNGQVTVNPLFGIGNLDSITITDVATVTPKNVYVVSGRSGNLYLVDNGNGNYSTTSNESEATKYSGTDPQLCGHTLYQSQYKITVGNSTLTMAPGVSPKSFDLAKTNVVAADGFALPNSRVTWSAHLNWGWLNFINAGWTQS